MSALYGHMSHLYDNPSLTLSQMKEVFEKAAIGELKGSEKTDGQNLYISYSVKDGRAKAARNKGNIKQGGLDAKGLAEKFSEHSNPNLVRAFSEAFNTFERAMKLLPEPQQLEIFGPDANIYYNAEIQDPRTPNVINYDSKNLTIHQDGHAEYDRESGKVTDKDVTQNFKSLVQALEEIQERVEAEDYGIQVKAINVLKGLEDQRPLKTALSRLEKEISDEGISDNQTIADYMISRVDNIISHQIKLGSQTQQELVRRILKQPSIITPGKNASVTSVLKTINKDDKEQKDKIRSLVNDAKIIVRTAIYPIEDIVHDFSVEMLRGLESAFILDNEKEVERLRTEVGDAIEKIKQSENEQAMEILNQQLRKLKDLENVSTATEGFVFRHDGHTYKFTGNFAPVNQILGLFKYGRKGIPPMQISEAKTKKKKADIGLYPGAFKPPHRGHIETVEELLKKAKKVVVLVSNPLKNTRSLPSGKVITAEESADLWKKYVKGLKNVEIVISPEASPVTATMKYLGDPVSDEGFTASEGAKVVLGCGDKATDAERYRNVPKYTRDDVKVELFSCPIGDKHSAEYVNLLLGSPHIYQNLPSVKSGKDPVGFHASDMRYIADLAASDTVAEELLDDFVPEGTKAGDIMSVLGIEKKTSITEVLFSLVESCMLEVESEKQRRWACAQLGDNFKGEKSLQRSKQRKCAPVK